MPRGETINSDAYSETNPTTNSARYSEQETWDVVDLGLLDSQNAWLHASAQTWQELERLNWKIF